MVSPFAFLFESCVSSRLIADCANNLLSRTLQGSGYLTSGEDVASFEKTHVPGAAVFIKSQAVRRAQNRPCGHGLEEAEDNENALPRSLTN